MNKLMIKAATVLTVVFVLMMAAHAYAVQQSFRYVVDTDSERARSVRFIAEHIKSVNSKVDNTMLAFAIYDESFKAKIDPLFTTAIIEKESTYRVNCLGAAHERGLMQIHPCHMRNFDWSKINEADYNIRCGLVLFNGYLSRAKGDLRKASGYYTGGRSSRYMSLYMRLTQQYHSIKTTIN
jgi:soluble lytic murein transglycosylase-like protein